MLPNMRLPRVNTRLTTMTVNRKNIRLRKEVTIRQRFLNCLSFFILYCSCSARGRSSVKSDSGRVEGCGVEWSAGESDKEISQRSIVEFVYMQHVKARGSRQAGRLEHLTADHLHILHVHAQPVLNVFVSRA